VSWQLAAFLMVSVALVLGFAWYERSRPSSRVLALVATLVAIAVLGRLAFAAIPNVKPATTDVILFAGFVLGAAPGFATGAITALVSNFFISQGSWTPWQMAAWGLVGIFGAVLARVAGRDLGRWPLAVACALAGFGFGAVMNLYQWTLAANQDAGTWVAISGQSFPFDLAHAVGNFAFCLLLGPAFVRAIARYRRRFEFRWPASAAGGTAALVLVCVAALVGAPRADASPAGRALSYLARVQNSDGGFGASPHASSSQMYTGWAALGIAAGGRNPGDVRRGGHSGIDYTRAHAGAINDVGEIERTILLLHAAGVSPHHFAGRDLVAELIGHRRSNGSFEGSVNWTSFGILALRAAGGAPLQQSATWLRKQQNHDGGWGPAPHASSDVDDTGAVLEALAAAGVRSGHRVGHALHFLTSAQNRDGGFGQYRGYDSNTQSTAWAVQGLVAIGRDPSGVRRHGHDPLGYIVSLQRKDGSVRYARSSSQTPVFVTSQAIMALRRKAFPLKPVRAKSTAARKAARGSGPAAIRVPVRPSRASGGGGPTGPPGTRSGAPTRTSGPARAAALRRAAERTRAAGGPSAALVLLCSGAALLLVGSAGLVRFRRRARPAGG